MVTAQTEAPAAGPNTPPPLRSLLPLDFKPCTPNSSIDEPPLYLWPFQASHIITGKINATTTWGPPPPSVFNLTDHLPRHLTLNLARTKRGAHNPLRTSKTYFQEQLGLFAPTAPWEWFVVNRLAILVATSGTAATTIQSAQRIACQIVYRLFMVLQCFNGKFEGDRASHNLLCEAMKGFVEMAKEGGNWPEIPGNQSRSEFGSDDEDPNASFSIDEDDEDYEEGGDGADRFAIHEAAALYSVARRLFLYSKDGTVSILAPQVTMFLIYRMYVTMLEYLSRARKQKDSDPPPIYSAQNAGKPTATKPNQAFEAVHDLRQPLGQLSVNAAKTTTPLGVYSVMCPKETRDGQIRFTQSSAHTPWSELFKLLSRLWAPAVLNENAIVAKQLVPVGDRKGLGGHFKRGYTTANGAEFGLGSHFAWDEFVGELDFDEGKGLPGQVYVVIWCLIG